MSNQKLNSQELANLSTEELLNLSWDSIEEVKSFVYPAGVYTANLVAAEIPNPAEQIEYFNFKFQLTGVVELENEEELTSANNIIAGGKATYQNRYYTKGGFGVQKMRTDLGNLMQGVCGEGASLGQFFGAMASGDAVPVVLLLKVDTTKPNKKKGETYETYTPKLINELGGVQLAE